MKIFEGQNVPIKSWCNKPEQGAIEQAKNLSKLPFIFRQVCLMSDTHRGYGMPIGGVIATKGVVIPNAVGCFTGDTKVPLLNGTQKTLRELAIDGKDVYVYSLDKDLNLVPGKAIPLLTRRNADLVEVIISGGDVIKCTLDHKFMLLDGSYKEAKDLEKFDSLMPLYRSYQSRDGYERIRTVSGNGIITHKMVAKQFYGKKKDTDVIHHKDGNWFNNEPCNLEYKDAKLHNKEHGKNNFIFRTKEFQEKKMRTIKTRGYFYDEKFTESKKETAIKNLSEYNKSDKKKEQDKFAGKRCKKYLIKYNKEKNNHKILSVKKLNYSEDVYCLTVEKYHNFVLSAGVFVHNCDIGCGMCAMKTSLTEITTEQLKKILGGSKRYQGGIRDSVPVGNGAKGSHKKTQNENLMPEKMGYYEEIANDFRNKYPIVGQEYQSALKQLGTLGGGNHFIEIQKGDDGFIWVMIHSGSRNLGYKVAKHYNKLAQDLCEKWYSNIPKFKGEDGLAFLPLNCENGSSYVREMYYCLEFAYANRLHMLENVKKAFLNVIDCTFEKEINIHHNFAQLENHFNKNVVIHRKGATSAKEGELGIIPGSQGTASYIVKGKGNLESFMSCSHGAGRKMSRTKARNELNLEEEIKKLNEQGILHAIRDKGDLDEASSAYKDIDIVMEEQKDLVEILIKLKPLAVIKG